MNKQMPVLVVASRLLENYQIFQIAQKKVCYREKVPTMQ